MERDGCDYYQATPPQVPPPRDAAKYDEAMRRPGVGVAAGTARGNGDRVDKYRTPNLGRGFAK